MTSELSCYDQKVTAGHSGSWYAFEKTAWEAGACKILRAAWIVSGLTTFHPPHPARAGKVLLLSKSLHR